MTSRHPPPYRHRLAPAMTQEDLVLHTLAGATFVALKWVGQQFEEVSGWTIPGTMHDGLYGPEDRVMAWIDTTRNACIGICMGEMGTDRTIADAMHVFPRTSVEDLRGIAEQLLAEALP